MKESLKQLAINDEGFAFDPRTGDCFRLNSSAQFIIRQLKLSKTEIETAKLLSAEFQVNPDQALEDVQDLMLQIKIQGLAA
jgi:hypothetical protein